MRFKWFQMVASAILMIFMGLMAVVTVIAFSRRSGSTGLDMAQIHQIRFEVAYKNIEEPRSDTIYRK